MTVRRIIQLPVAFAFALLTLTLVSVHSAQAVSASGTFEPIGEVAHAPTGWIDFCKRNATDCGQKPKVVREISLTSDIMHQLVSVNDWVNKAVLPMTDRQHYGIEDYWTYPDSYGDCEDYALLKREMLIDRGIPAEDLLMTVAWDRNEGHALLTVHTVQGDYVLDNKERDVRRWAESGYEFVKRQSQVDASAWIYIDGVPPSQPALVASTGKPESPTPALESTSSLSPSVQVASVAAPPPAAIAQVTVSPARHVRVASSRAPIRVASTTPQLRLTAY